VESVRLQLAFLTVTHERVCAFRQCSDRLCHVILREVERRFVFGGRQPADVVVTCTVCNFVLRMFRVQSLSALGLLCSLNFSYGFPSFLKAGICKVREVGPSSVLFSTH
jgi:hypothetical protein